VTPLLTREVKSTCCYCGVGCGVIIETDGAAITGVRGDPDHPANFGKLCSKGATLHLSARPELRSSRLLHPEMRTARNVPRARARWDEALDLCVKRFLKITGEHGPDAVAFYVSGQLLTEDYYVFNKLAKGLIGTNNIDSNSRLCMSSAVAGYKQTLGADSPPCSYEDIDLAHCLFIAGSNTAYAHPILYRRIEEAKAARPELKVIVVDPRKTETAREADLHLAILPGTDVALFHGMLHVMLWEGLTDGKFIAAHTEGFDALKSAVHEFTPKAVAEICGISEADLVLAAKWFGESAATLSLYCQGLNQSTSGTAKNAALINLHLATGQIGKPGAGPFSLTGQPNAMGGREVGGMANLLSGHRDLSNAEHRAEVARMWGVERVPQAPGKTAVELFEGLRTKTIRAVWIVCTNPAQSMPYQVAVHEALRNAEFVVVQEAYRNTETTWYADVLLPAASWGEKEGTVTNSERRISRVRAAAEPPGQARPDWEIARDFARKIETRMRPGKPSMFSYTTAESVWMEHRDSTRGRDLDITGLSYATLEEAPRQWPFLPGESEGKVRLYEDGRFATPSGKARFMASAYRPVAESADAHYPFRLITGRLRDQWHGMTRTGSVAQLFAHAPEPAIGMHPQDLERRGLAAGDLLRVESRRGHVYALAVADASLRLGQVYLPMHWGARFLGGRDILGVNTLTLPAYDKDSKQPELKHSAVRIERAELPWRLAVFSYASTGTAAALLDSLTPLLPAFAFSSVVLFGREEEGVLMRLADKQSPSLQTIEDIDRRFGLAQSDVLRYDDLRRGVGRRVNILHGRLRGVRLSGDGVQLAAEAWLKEWLVSGEPVTAIRRFLLAPTATAPSGFVSPGKVVCSCLNVTDTQITSALAQASGTTSERVKMLQGSLRCGTNCGSCLPEVRRFVETCIPQPVAA
jgi:assimilatory nitrate reductase catalytic subunit